MTQPREGYTPTTDPEMRAIMAQRTAADWAAFFLPHLRPGFALLDCGCGPGTITVGLAERVAPGRVVGIDLNTAQSDEGRALARERGLDIEFRSGDVYNLDFPDGSFDAVFAHTILQHLRDPVKALREIRRVLKPGGIVGVRDEDWRTVLLEPSNPLLERALELLFRIWQHNGGNPFYPRHLRRLMLEAGFGRAVGSASARCLGNETMTPALPRTLGHHLSSTAAVKTVVENGWSTAAEVREICDELERWSRRPDAYFAFLFCEAVGFNAPAASTR